MSTYWGYICESHDPALASEHWFNHGEDTLIETFIRERGGEWPDEPMAVGVDDLLEGYPLPVVHRSYETTAPIFWLRDHPRCQIALQNEYGDRRAIAETVTGGVVREPRALRA